MAFTCRGCDRKWTGYGMAHCAAAGCHETFSTVSNFDSHRVKGECRDPRTMTSLRAASGPHGVTWVKRGEYWIGEAA